MQVSAGEWQRPYIFKFLVLSEPQAPTFNSLKPAGFVPGDVDYFAVDVDVPDLDSDAIDVLWSGQWATYAGRI